MGEGLFFLIKSELIPLCRQLLACNNSPLKHEQWGKKMLSSLPFPLTYPSGCGSSFTSYLRASGDHFSHSQPASLWHIYYTALMNSFPIFYNWTPQPDFNCLRHRPQHNIYLSDLAGIQPLADYSWLPPKFATIKKFMFPLYTSKNESSSLSLYQFAPTRRAIGLPWWFSGKEATCNAGDSGSILR